MAAAQIPATKLLLIGVIVLLAQACDAPGQTPPGDAASLFDAAPSDSEVGGGPALDATPLKDAPGELGPDTPGQDTLTQDAPPAPDAPDADAPETLLCAPQTCSQLQAQCGSVDDTCGNDLDCGTCSSDQTCEDNVCASTCIAPSCAGVQCGVVPNPCGDPIFCGECADGMACVSTDGINICSPEPCVPKTCSALPSECGLASDGCGAVVDCGSCSAGLECTIGSGGAPNSCTPIECVPSSCSVLAAQCGFIGDGCGNSLDCGLCPTGFVCGATAPNVCTQEVCTPTTCAGEGVSCGPVSDGCGATLDCGGCGAGETCDEGSCASSCADDCDDPWAETCSGSGGYKVCGVDPQTGCSELSTFIACQTGSTCSATACEGACVVPEIYVVVDRSSSMAGPVWDETQQELVSLAQRYQHAAKLGLRAFPGESTCEPGPVYPIALQNADTFSSNLVTPSAVSSTPLGQALAGLDQSFGDPSQGEFVILLSDGSETCGATSDAVNEATLLANRGAKVFTIGLGPGYDQPLLENIAAAGGGEFLPSGGPGGLHWVLIDLMTMLIGCDQPVGGIAGCQQGMCESQCPENTHLCEGWTGFCVQDDDATLCGENCDFCPLVANGTPICVSGGCDFQCDPGYAACEGGCQLDSDADGNGGSCDICPGYDDDADMDGDGVPDGCDPDIDGDGCPNGADDAPTSAGPDTDGDGTDDDCDDDDDGDDCPDEHDPAPLLDDGGCTPSCPPGFDEFSSIEPNDTLATAQDLGGPWFYTPSRICVIGEHHCTSSSWLSGEKDHVLLSVNPADFSWNPDAKLDLTLRWTYPADMDIRTYSVDDGEYVFSSPVQQGKQETASVDVAPTTDFPSYIIETRCDSGPPGPQDYVLLIEFSLPN